MIEFPTSDLPALSRLLNDPDFDVFMNRLESWMYETAVQTLQMDGVSLYRMQGAATFAGSIAAEVKNAPKKLERFKEKVR